METIATVDNIMTSGRPISKNLNPDVVIAYIIEAEQLYIKPAIGGALFLDIITKRNEYSDLLEGCAYCDNSKIHSGLLNAIAYYVQGLILRNNNIQTTRYRAIEKSSEYGNGPSESTLNAQYNSIMGAGDAYLNEVIDYLNYSSYPLYKSGRIIKQRIKVKVL